MTVMIWGLPGSWTEVGHERSQTAHKTTALLQEEIERGGVRDSLLDLEGLHLSLGGSSDPASSSLLSLELCQFPSIVFSQFGVCSIVAWAMSLPRPQAYRNCGRSVFQRVPNPLSLSLLAGTEAAAGFGVAWRPAGPPPTVITTMEDI